MKNNIYELRKYWLGFYQNKRPYLVCDDIWEYYCEIFEPTLRWETEYNIFLNFIEKNNIETLSECVGHVDGVLNDIFKKVDRKKLFSKKHEPYSTCFASVPDGYYFVIDLCNASFNYFIKNGIIKEDNWGDFVGTDDEFINHKVFKMFIYNNIGYLDRFSINKQYLDNIVNSENSLIYDLKQIKHTLYYLGDALLFRFEDEKDVANFISKVSPLMEIGGEKVHTDIFKKQTLIFNKTCDKMFSQIAVIEDVTTGKLEFKNNNFIDYQLYLPQIQKLYLNEKTIENDLIYGYYDRINKFNIPLSIININ